ncbi:hypothetical protein CDO52_17035 [Nocardiopsis gilva YIM 90087]|uniref:Secreted protein n=1 Tax=Nocardiopsis gilva YIM 90087 TaxID=1235441 RepID=A0A223S865_9ACTN|nr:hypothetical protein [Nocardiopsis gilva]ASU84272.1 hypothetical protein CDO52_17035 [Nocardiopsis gilva YIM 90087]
MQHTLLRRSAVVASGLGLAAGLMGAPAAAADARPLSAPAAANVTVQSAPRTSEAAAEAKCRTARSKIHGARIKGKICWSNRSGGGWKNASIQGWVKDTKGDGNYAQFRIHYRTKVWHGWQTKTKVIKSTKGRKAPVTKSAHWYYNGKGVKDVWIQVCKKGRGGRICDNRWR